ncbi:MAG TPA: TMEM175 family protein [Solirubrobacteraceae bacterium]|nr:TMEM175 family protein [Solirubrobacteraceae bacterium]
MALTSGEGPSDGGPTVDGVVLPKSRLAAFSDGVFAIAITLLVLSLAVQSSQAHRLLDALSELWPAYLAYLTSFFMIGRVWMAHHLILTVCKGIDRTAIKLNLILLFAVSFLPFPTSLLGQFVRDSGAERVAAVFYGVWLLLIAVLIAALWRYVSADRRLLIERLPDVTVTRLTNALEPSVALYGAAIVLALFLPQVAAGAYLAIAVFGFIISA